MDADSLEPDADDPHQDQVDHKLSIPTEIRAIVLPSPTLDILSFVDFSLPPLATSNPPKAAFSLASSSVHDPSTIRKLPVPSQETVRALYRDRMEAIGQGLAASLRYTPQTQSASSLHLPLWVVTLWDEVLRLRAPDGPYTRWKKAETALRGRRKIWNTKKSSASYSAVETTYTMLTTLTWSGFVHGFDNLEPIESLATYATRDWLSDVHENQMLDLLRMAVTRRADGQRFEVENAAFWKFLTHAYDKRELGTYLTDRYFVRPRGLGEALARGDRDIVVMIVNLSNVHWIAVAVDFREKSILYGDSLGGKRNAQVLAVLEWWTAAHSGGEPFKCEALQITRQPDFHSCGLASWNAVAHLLLPDRYPLLDPTDLDTARLHVMHDVLQQHMDSNEVRVRPLATGLMLTNTDSTTPCLLTKTGPWRRQWVQMTAARAQLQALVCGIRPVHHLPTIQSSSHPVHRRPSPGSCKRARMCFAP